MALVTARDDRPGRTGQARLRDAHRTAGSADRRADPRRPESRPRNGSCARTVAVSSRAQSIARSPGGSGGCQPRSLRCATVSSAVLAPCATRASAARTALTAPSVTSWRYRLLLRARRIGNAALPHTGPGVEFLPRLAVPSRPSGSPRAKSPSRAPRDPGRPAVRDAR